MRESICTQCHVNNLARTESFWVFNPGFSSLINNISNIKQSNFDLHFLKTENCLSFHLEDHDLSKSDLKDKQFSILPGVLGTRIHHHLCKRTRDICTIQPFVSKAIQLTKFLRDQGTCKLPFKREKALKRVLICSNCNGVKTSSIQKKYVPIVICKDRESHSIDASARSNRSETSVATFHCRKPLPSPPLTSPHLPSPPLTSSPLPPPLPSLFPSIQNRVERLPFILLDLERALWE